MKSLILAGGLGTRLAERFPRAPKPLVPVAGVPVLERQLRALRDAGCDEVMLSLGHRSDQVLAFVGDGSGVSPATGEPFGISVSALVEPRPLGTAGALALARDWWRGSGDAVDDLLVINGDLVFNVDLGRLLEAHRAQGALATVLAHPNAHPFDSALLDVDDRGRVRGWLLPEEPRPRWCHNLVNAGMHVLSGAMLDRAPELIGTPGERRDLDRDVLAPLAARGELAVYRSSEYVADMGTPARLDAVERDVRSGRVARGSRSTPRPAVFFDRDGTLNQAAGYVCAPEDLRLLPGAAQAVRRVNEAGLLAVLVTNQPQVARGDITFGQLDLIHAALETLLGREGAYLDAIYACPHHPDRGFPGERPELKGECSCRKPRPGMLLRAAEELNIDLARSWMVGDRPSDVEAGTAAGCRTVLISAEAQPPEGATAATRLAASASEAVDAILREGDSAAGSGDAAARAHLDELCRRYPSLVACAPAIARAYEVLAESFASGGMLLVAGNGGSAADADHIVGELMKGFKLSRQLPDDATRRLRAADAERGPLLAARLQGALPSLAIHGQPGLSTAFANDVDATLSYAQQVQGYGRDGDVLLAISTSGNAENVLFAVTAAKAKGMRTIALTGAGGGKLAQVADVVIRVPDDETYRIQELHLPVYHALCLMLEERFFGDGSGLPKGGA